MQDVYLTQHAVLAFRKNKCQNNSHHGCQGQAGNGNGSVYRDAVTADTQDKDDRSHQQVTAVAEVQPGMRIRTPTAEIIP